MISDTTPIFNRCKVIRSQRKTIAIQITPDAQVLVRCPNRMPIAAVEAFVQKKADWIQKHLQKKDAQPNAEPFTDAQIREFADRTRGLLEKRLPALSRQVGVSYHQISVRSQRTRWGSCSSKGNLNFNCLLALVPPEVFDYVAVHELCHLKQMNHSPAFWAEVEKVLPDYKTQKYWLKEHGPQLIAGLSK